MAASTVLTTDDVGPRASAPPGASGSGGISAGSSPTCTATPTSTATWVASHAGDVILTRLEANRHRVLRSPHGAHQRDRLPEDRRALAGQRRGGAAGPPSLRSGGWVIYDTTGSYAIANPERVDHLIVMVPKDQMAERGLRLGDLMARHVGGASGISRVALETMRNTYQELPHMSEDVARGAGELIMQLVRLSLLELAGQETAVTSASPRTASASTWRSTCAIRAVDRQHRPGAELQQRHLYNAFHRRRGRSPATSSASAWKPACATWARTPRPCGRSPKSRCPGASPTSRISAGCFANTRARAPANFAAAHRATARSPASPAAPAIRYRYGRNPG